MNEEFVGKTLAGKYEIEEIIRESELGTIYRGKHLLMDKPVTIKILSPALAVDESIVEKFSTEARTISRLSHPNILNVTDFGRDDETVFIVMEDLEGDNLKDLIKRDGAFEVERAVRLTRQIAAALSSAHASGIVHKNLTSEKILVARLASDTELVKVLEIGSFERDVKENEIGEDKSEDKLDEIAYLSPEQCSGESEPDERSDTYALGIIFYEMLTGEVPFMADTALDLMLKHSQVPPPPLAAFREDVPEEVEPIVLRALAKNPDLRYQSAAAFAEDLSDAIRVSDEDDTIVIPKTAAAAAGAETGTNNQIWKTAFILLAGISILAFGMIYMTNMKQTDPDTEYTVDADGKPVQPLSSATGLNEKGVAVTDYPDPTLNPEGAEILPTDPGIGGGDGFDPWANGGGFPPAGAPQAPIGPGEGIITIPPDSGSPFDPEEEAIYDSQGRRIYLVPVPKKSPTEGEKDKPTEGKTPADAGKTDANKKPESKPAEKAPAKDAKPKTPPAEKPKDKPAPPASGSSNKTQSGVRQDS